MQLYHKEEGRSDIVWYVLNYKEKGRKLVNVQGSKNYVTYDKKVDLYDTREICKIRSQENFVLHDIQHCFEY